MMAASHNVKVSKVLRVILSFVMCFFAVLLSVSICSKTTFTNTDCIQNLFTGKTYVSGLCENVTNYASDLCIKNGISDKNVSKVFAYSEVEQATVAYINYYIGSETGYTQNAYTDKINEICENYKEEIINQLDSMEIDYTEEQVDNFSSEVADYFKSEVEINHIDYLKTFINIGSMASNIMIAVTTVFTFIFFILLLFIGKKRYRSIRSISAGFLSAAFIDLFASLILTIISNIKKVDIFPIYLRDIFMEYVNLCIGRIALAGACLLIVSLVILAIAWKFKRKDK